MQPEDADSIEIATNCIAECFHVDPNDQTAMKDAVGGQNLLSIYGVYEKLKGKNTTSTPSAPSAAGAGSSAPTPQGAPTEESEKLKGLGNAAMQKKDYQTAADQYTKALEVCPLNPIYLSNRAAAFSAMQKHDLAKNDAELATATDPKYTKAWSRLGLARFALGDAKGSMEAYKAGIDAEGNGGSDAMKRGYETAKRKVEEEEDMPDLVDDDSAPAARGAGGAGGAGGMPDLSGLASMLGGGGGGGGGMVRNKAAEALQIDLETLLTFSSQPDLGALMQNPMMRQMAQSLMSNPDMMNNLMGSLGGAGRGGGGGGMPDLSAMMNDPNIAEM